MTDPSFGAIEFNGIDAWDGSCPFAHQPSRLSEFAVHVWADEEGPSAGQRDAFSQLKACYPALWPTIALCLLENRGDMTSVEELSSHLSPKVACYMEVEDGGVHPEFELVYTFDLPEEGIRAYFVRVVAWDVAEVVEAA